MMKFKAIFSFSIFSLSFLSLIVSVSAASLPSPSLTVPASLQVGTKAIIPFTFSSNIFADVLSPQHPGLQFLLCKASETTPALCVQGARSDARNSLSRPAPFFEGSAARDKGSAGSFELDLMRVVPGTYNLYVFAVWWPTSSKGIVAGRYDTYKSPSFEVGARPEVEVVSPISGVIFQPGNKYHFEWRWKGYDGVGKGWKNVTTYVYKSDQTTAAPSVISDPFQVAVDTTGRSKRTSEGASFDLEIPLTGYEAGLYYFKFDLEMYDTEAQSIAERFRVSIPVRLTGVLGDIAGNDNKVSIQDISALALFIDDVRSKSEAELNRISSYKANLVSYDLNQDRKVDVEDLILLAGNYGKNG